MSIWLTKQVIAFDLDREMKGGSEKVRLKMRKRVFYGYVLAFIIANIGWAYDVNKDITNLGPTADDVAVILSGPETVTAQFNGYSSGSKQGQFGSFAHGPSGANTKLHWQNFTDGGNNRIDTNQTIHIGWSTADRSSSILDMYWTDASGNRIPGSVVYNVTTQWTYETATGQVILQWTNPYNVPLSFFDVFFEITPTPVPLEELNLENTLLNDRLQLLPQGQQFTLPPAGTMSLPLPIMLPPDANIILRYRVDGQNNMAQTIDFVQFPVKPPVEPFVALDTQDQWMEALNSQSIMPVSSADWENYLAQWQQFRPSGMPPYPQNMFQLAELSVFAGVACPDPIQPDAPGLVMAWGSPTQTSGSYSSAWQYQYPADPDLSNVTINITVLPPPWINVVSFGMKDINGNIRAWYWNVAAAAGPGTLAAGVPTAISIDTSQVGVGTANPNAASYANNPAFDITHVQTLIVDENANWVAGQGVPPPGQTISKMWNYWYNLIVCPNPPPQPAQILKWSQPPVACKPRIFLGWDEPSIREQRPLMADDWVCTDWRPVTDIHWWGSFLNWRASRPPLMPRAFHIAIWTDVPGIPQDLQSFSHPDQLIWEYFCTDFQWKFVGFDMDPRSPTATSALATSVNIRPQLADSCFAFTCVLPTAKWFYQDPGPCGRNVYWISISAIYDTPTQPIYLWGWKTRPHFCNDDAVKIVQLTDGTWPPKIGSVWGNGIPLEFPHCISWDLAFELTTNKICDPAGPPNADVNHDNIVNLIDLSYLAAQWLTPGP